MITIIPTGGLANRLRVIFSYYRIAVELNNILEVIWKVDDACNGFFTDYFEPVKDIIFYRKNISGNKVIYKGCHSHPKYQPNYELLKLNPDLQNLIEQKQNTIDSKYIAVHIRRTDHINLAKKINMYTTDDDFVKFINKYPEYDIYLATDNRNTQDKFISMYKNRIKFVNLIDKHNTNLRKTSLRDAIIDVYVCKGAEFFKGSGRSSFSTLINDLRQD
jgi:hypothetical protein